MRTPLLITALVLAILVPMQVSAGPLVTPVVTDRAVAKTLAAAPQLGSWRGRDAIWNGVIIGAVAGGAALGFLEHALDDCDCGVHASTIAIGAALGAGVGAGVDALLSRRWSAPTGSPSPARVRVAPFIAKRQKGVVAQVAF